MDERIDRLDGARVAGADHRRDRFAAAARIRMSVDEPNALDPGDRPPLGMARNPVQMAPQARISAWKKEAAAA